jgi:competence protein ComEA
LKEWINEHISYIVAIALVIFVFIFYIFSPVSDQKPKDNSLETELLAKKNEPDKEQVETKPKTIMADVKGAVVNPGVYEAKEGERVIDIITRAGGLTEKADQAQVNLAMYIEDEMVLYVPEIGEIEEPNLVTGASDSKEDKVNINKAEPAELETLSGIGPSKSAAIIEYRNTNGPFKTIEDIQSVSGFGEKTFEKLKDKITVK